MKKTEDGLCTECEAELCVCDQAKEISTQVSKQNMRDIKFTPGRTVLIFPLIFVTIDYEVVDTVKTIKGKIHGGKRIVTQGIIIKDTKDFYNEETAFNQTQRGLRKMHLHIMRYWELQEPTTFNEAVALFNTYKIRYHRYCAID